MGSLFGTNNSLTARVKQRKIPLWTVISGLFVLLWVLMAEGMLRMIVTHSLAKCASLKPIIVLVERDEEAEVAITSAFQE